MTLMSNFISAASYGNWGFKYEVRRIIGDDRFDGIFVLLTLHLNIRHNSFASLKALFTPSKNRSKSEYKNDITWK